MFLASIPWTISMPALVCAMSSLWPVDYHLRMLAPLQSVSYMQPLQNVWNCFGSCTTLGCSSWLLVIVSPRDLKMECSQCTKMPAVTVWSSTAGHQTCSIQGRACGANPWPQRLSWGRFTFVTTRCCSPQARISKITFINLRWTMKEPVATFSTWSSRPKTLAMFLVALLPRLRHLTL